MSLPDGWIGTGRQTESGQAWVYQVHRRGEPDGPLYALKRLKNPERRGRFVREVEIMKRLRSEHDAAVPEIIEEDLSAERPWFVTPWFPDGSLEDVVMSARFRSDLPGGLDVLERLAEILSDVHAVAAHRDLKPANVLVDGDTLALADFGLCLELDDENFRLTDVDEAVGSRFYIAPENEAGINPEQDQRPADFYAFGKLAWALLSGCPPLPREEIVEPQNRLVSTLDEPRLGDLDGLLRDLLNRDPRARLTNWATVLRELRALSRVLAGAEETSPRPIPERTVSLARRLRDSTSVRDSFERGEQRQREQAWFTGLMQELSERARIVDAPLLAVTRELEGVLSIGPTTGGGLSTDQLLRSGLTLPFELPDRPLLGDPTSSAVCFLIHSPRAIDHFPSIVIRVVLTYDGNDLWVTRIPMMTPAGGTEEVAGPLTSSFFRVSGPFTAFRRATIDEALLVVEETARLFVTLVEHYLEMVDAGLDPSDAAAWEGREIRPAELVAIEDGARGDTQAPDLRSFEISPTVVEVSDAPVTVTCRVRLTDDEAGVAGEGFTTSPSQARFQSSSGQFGDFMFHHLTRVSGSSLDGVYEDHLALPAAAERGPWRLQYVRVVDQVGNARNYDAPELQASGFPTSFEVR